MRPVKSETCDGSVSGASAKARSKSTESRARASIAGVEPWVYPYDGNRSERSVSRLTTTTVVAETASQPQPAASSRARDARSVGRRRVTGEFFQRKKPPAAEAAGGSCDPPARASLEDQAEGERVVARRLLVVD